MYEYNKYQKTWVDLLLSGLTVKCKKLLGNEDNTANCCLGLGILACKLDHLPSLESRREKIKCENLRYFAETCKALKLHDSTGSFHVDNISQEWKDKLREHQIEHYSSLVYLNDNTDMTHKDIGQFIDENREAVFK